MDNLLLWCIYCSVAFVFADNLPRPIGAPGEVHEERAAVGDDIKIHCPVQKQDKMLYTWKKDGEEISSGWDRVQLRSDFIKISNLMTSDQGEYQCDANGGFGSVIVSVMLYVSDATNGTDDGNSGNGAAPSFVGDSREHQQMTIQIGNTLSLRCKASGKPKPIINWFFNGQKIRDQRTGEDFAHAHLERSFFQTSDVGLYKCRALNTWGKVERTFKVDELETVPRSVLEVVDPEPENATAQEGNIVTLQCYFRSMDEPQFKWLKHLVSVYDTDVRRINGSMKYQGQMFGILQSNLSVAMALKNSEKGGKVYLHRLILNPVSITDAGMYVCLAANSQEVKVRLVHLTVKSNPDRYNNQPEGSASNFFSSPFTAIIIGIPAAIVIIVIIVIIYLLFQRRKQRNAQKQAPPPRKPLPIVEKPYDHVYSPVHSPYHNQPAPCQKDRVIYSDLHSDASMAHHHLMAPSPQQHYHGTC